MKNYKRLIISAKVEKTDTESKILTTGDLPAWVVYVVYEGIFQYYLSGIHFSITQAENTIKSLPITTECRIERYVKPNFK